MSNIVKSRISVIKSSILISNFHPSLKAPFTHRYLESEIAKVFKGEKTSVDTLCVNLVEKKDIRRINKKYLKHDYFTDIITFPYVEEKGHISGEIFMCLNVIKENSKIYRTSYRNEFRRVLIHGCLHLAGYNDSNSKERELIREKENFYLSL